jgi:NitT/TauT family transport system ATP-binding protein
LSAAAPVRFDRVSVDYHTDRGTFRAVDDVSFDIASGDFLALIGPSGCGKTTLMNCLAGFTAPTGGSVTLNGRPVAGPGPDRGVMFQDYGVFPWLTVEENIDFGLTLKANRLPAAERAAIRERYLDLMKLRDFRAAYPKMLSGGMRQRLALARTYATKPEYLLMDEPFGALDAQTRSAMQELLQSVLQSERKTVLLITHSVEEALLLASRIAVISARPARLREMIDVPFPYPRGRGVQDDPEFVRLRRRIRDLVMEEYAEQEKQRATNAA